MPTPIQLVRSAIAVAILAACATNPLPAANLDEVLARFDEVQNSIQTLSAAFTETTLSTLLEDEIIAEGRVYLTKPYFVRWEYSLPEELRFVISNNTYTGYFPMRKKAERRDIQRWREQLFRFLGLGQASTELAKFYDIRLEEAGPDMPGTHLLILDPKKRRVRKRMDVVRFWVSEATSLPVRVEYYSKSGNVRLIEFREMSVNPELAANLYTVEIPPDVPVTKGFSALSGLTSPSDD